ncbi:MAG: hypothetical protein HKN31_09140 [Pricia sp.]|nr:hypothetical protein [Pricia sp.]
MNFETYTGSADQNLSFTLDSGATFGQKSLGLPVQKKWIQTTPDINSIIARWASQNGWFKERQNLQPKKIQLSRNDTNYFESPIDGKIHRMKKDVLNISIQIKLFRIWIGGILLN